MDADKFDGNCKRMLRVILYKSWKQHPTKHQLYGHLPLITKTIQIRRTRHTVNCWRSKAKLISDVIQWTSSYGQADVGRPVRIYQQQLWTDSGNSLEDLPNAMDNRDEWHDMMMMMMMMSFKVLPYFGNMKHDSATPVAFAEVLELTNHTRLWDDELAWYSPRCTRQICLYDLQ